MGRIAITTGGVKQSLSNYNALKSICEYIWNGFDAGAKQSYERTRITGIHGKNGVGRLTFFCFAQYAEWNTIYKENENFKNYSITIDANNLENYKETDENIIETKGTGTTVILSGIYQNIDIYELNEYIKKEFACLLELNKKFDFSICIDGEEVLYEDLIIERENFEFNYKYGDLNINARIRYVQWKNK